MITKRIVCLANSRKIRGRCVAGKELINGQAAGWIRLVSDRENGEVSEYERRYKDGSDPQLLDIMNVSLLEPRLTPGSPQRENWLIDPKSCWETDSCMQEHDLASLVDHKGPLWLNVDSTYNGLNDRIPFSSASNLDGSLRFIQVDKLIFSVFRPGKNFGNPKRRVQGQFQYGGDEYHLWVTDPGFERVYLDKKDGKYKIGSCFLTVSLGEPYGRYYYKFIAAIIPCDKVIMR